MARVSLRVPYRSENFFNGNAAPEIFFPYDVVFRFPFPFLRETEVKIFPPPPSPPEWKFNARGPKGRIVPADGRWGWMGELGAFVHFFSLFSLTPLLFRTIEMQKLRKRNPVSIVVFEKKKLFCGTTRQYGVCKMGASRQVKVQNRVWSPLFTSSNFRFSIISPLSPACSFLLLALSPIFPYQKGRKRRRGKL